MSGAHGKAGPIVPRLVFGLAIVLLVAGGLWYGFSAEVFHRFLRDLAERPGGPMTFRFVLQPLMAAIVALRAGIEDARSGRPAYLWDLATGRHHRLERLDEAMAATVRIFVIGLVMDGVYQALVLKTFYPGEMVVVAVTLACLPYLLLRDPAALVARWWLARKARRAS